MTEPTLTCDDVRDMAAELALGVVSGGARAAAVEHLAECPACRAQVESLADVADAILLLAPQAEPPLGFESRVIERLPVKAEPAPRRWRLATAAAVAIAVLGTAVGLSGMLERPSGDKLDREYVQALRVLGGRSLTAGRLTDGTGTGTGEVFLYDGHPSWVFVTVADADASGPLTVELRWPGTAPLVLHGLTVSHGVGSLGQRIDHSLAGLQSVRVRGAGVDYMGHFDGEPAHADMPGEGP